MDWNLALWILKQHLEDVDDWRIREALKMLIDEKEREIASYRNTI